jgi:hypothetical protein
MYDLAYDYWCLAGGSAARAERHLRIWVEENTGDGEEARPIPARSTIAGWAKADDWERRQIRELRDGGLKQRLLRLEIRKLRQIESAYDIMDDIDAGVYDDNPAEKGVMSRLAIEKMKVFGVGTAGANAGGLQATSIQALVDEVRDDTALSAGEISKNNRHHWAEVGQG